MSTHGRTQSARLSREGMERKDEIRVAARRAVADRRRGTHVVTTVCAAAIPVVAILAVWIQSAGYGTGSPAEDGRVVVATPGNGADVDGVEGAGTPRFRHVRFSVITSSPGRVKTINDDELLALLAEAGRPSGLIRVGDRVMVVERPRVDGAAGAGDAGGARGGA